MNVAVQQDDVVHKRSSEVALNCHLTLAFETPFAFIEDHNVCFNVVHMHAYGRRWIVKFSIEKS